MEYASMEADTATISNQFNTKNESESYDSDWRRIKRDRERAISSSLKQARRLYELAVRRFPKEKR
jgi:hypothetical protein